MHEHERSQIAIETVDLTKRVRRTRPRSTG